MRGKLSPPAVAVPARAGALVRPETRRHLLNLCSRLKRLWFYLGELGRLHVLSLPSQMALQKAISCPGLLPYWWGLDFSWLDVECVGEREGGKHKGNGSE